MGTIGVGCELGPVAFFASFYFLEMERGCGVCLCVCVCPSPSVSIDQSSLPLSLKGWNERHEPPNPVLFIYSGKH